MNDQNFFDLAMKAIARQASHSERAELDALLTSDPELKAEFDRLQADVRMAKETLALVNATEATSPEFPAYLRGRLQTKVRQTLGRSKASDEREQKRIMVWNWRRILGMATGAAVVVLLLFSVSIPFLTYRMASPLKASFPTTRHIQPMENANAPPMVAISPHSPPVPPLTPTNELLAGNAIAPSDVKLPDHDTSVPFITFERATIATGSHLKRGGEVFSGVGSVQDFQHYPLVGSNAPPPFEKTPTGNSLVASRAEERPLNASLTVLKGIVILGSYQGFKAEGVSGIQELDIEGPAFLKGHKAMMSVWTSDFLGKPLTLSALDRLQVNLIRTCRQLDRPVVDVYYPQQEIIDGVVQIIIYEGRIGRILVHMDDEMGLSENKFLEEVRLKPGEPVSEDRLLKEVARLQRVFSNISISTYVTQAAFSETNNAGNTTIGFHLKLKPAAAKP